MGGGGRGQDDRVTLKSDRPLRRMNCRMLFGSRALFSCRQCRQNQRSTVAESLKGQCAAKSTDYQWWWAGSKLFLNVVKRIVKISIMIAILSWGWMHFTSVMATDG